MPNFLLRSCEADVFTFRNPKDADLIDGSIGEGSPFHETFGYYAQGVWLYRRTWIAGKRRATSFGGVATDCRSTLKI